MTTNVICKRRKMLATDSRWSFEYDADHICYIDDTGFDKMADRHLGSIICAGDGPLIELWRNWFLTPILNLQGAPSLTRTDPNGIDKAITISLISKPDGLIRFSKGWYYDFEEEAKFSGSGAEFARDCYSTNRCGRTSVATASQGDPMTGGETKFIDIETAKTNLSQMPASMQDVHTQFGIRGMMMNISNRKVAPINGNDPKGIAQALSAGTLSLSAPTGQEIRPWSPREKQDLMGALSDLAQAEEAANA